MRAREAVRLPLVVGGALLVAVLAGPVVHGEDGGPVELAVADGFGYATPLGTVLRIPNQLDGGALLSTTTLSLDKTRAVAAGYTPGELGEAFLRTTIVAPEGTPESVGGSITYTNPSLVSAQTPPSDVFPSEAALAGGGVQEGGVEAASVRASTTPTSAAADAIGGVAVADQGGITFGSSGSRSTSRLLDDGTVVSEARAFLTDLRTPDDLLRIASITSVAKASLRPGTVPVTTLDIQVSGARIAGVAVEIDEQGIRVADTGLVSLAEVRTVNEALASLEDQGLTITVLPGLVREGDEQSATVGGAALSIRGDITQYVPTASETPLGVGSPLGDVGTDDEVLIGQVQASVFAAPRTPFPGAAPPSAPSAPSVANGTAAPLPARASDGPSGAPAPAPGRSTSGGQGSIEVAGPEEPAFELLRRSGDPGVAALRIGYRWVLLAALVGVLALMARRRARLI